MPLSGHQLFALGEVDLMTGFTLVESETADADRIIEALVRPSDRAVEGDSEASSRLTGREIIERFMGPEKARPWPELLRRPESFGDHCTHCVMVVHAQRLGVAVAT